MSGLGIICGRGSFAALYHRPFIHATVYLGGQYPSPYTLFQKFKFCGYVFENPDRYILHIIVNVFLCHVILTRFCLEKISFIFSSREMMLDAFALGCLFALRARSRSFPLSNR